MRVLPEGDVAVAIVQELPEPLLHARRLSQGAFPFAVDELRRIEPGTLLSVVRHIGPGLVRMTGEQQTLGDAKAGIVRREISTCDGHGKRQRLPEYSLQLRAYLPQVREDRTADGFTQISRA